MSDGLVVASCGLYLSMAMPRYYCTLAAGGHDSLAKSPESQTTTCQHVSKGQIDKVSGPYCAGSFQLIQRCRHGCYLVQWADSEFVKVN